MALNLPKAEKEQLVVSLAAIICADSGKDATAENLSAVISASENSIASYWAPLFASYIEKSEGIDRYFAGPGSGGGGAAAAPAAGGAAPSAGAPAAAAPEKPKEEEVDALDGGMDMFGGSGGEKGDY
eukprot:gene1766-3417_t